jgi:hypothetical protein
VRGGYAGLPRRLPWLWLEAATCAARRCTFPFLGCPFVHNCLYFSSLLPLSIFSTLTVPLSDDINHVCRHALSIISPSPSADACASFFFLVDDFGGAAASKSLISLLVHSRTYEDSSRVTQRMAPTFPPVCVSDGVLNTIRFVI